MVAMIISYPQGGNFPILRLLQPFYHFFQASEAVAELSHIGLSTLNSHFSALSALAITNCKKKVLWSGVRVALIYGYKHKYLGSGLAARTFNKTSVLHSSLKPGASLVTGFWSGWQWYAWISYLGAGLSSTLKVVGCALHTHAIVVLPWQVMIESYRFHN